MRLVRALVRGHTVHRGQEEPSVAERVTGILGSEAEVWRHPCVHLQGEEAACVSVSSLWNQSAVADVQLSSDYAWVDDGSATPLHR